MQVSIPTNCGCPSINITPCACGTSAIIACDKGHNTKVFFARICGHITDLMEEHGEKIAVRWIEQ